jgi:hypothetical protein
MSCLIAMEKRIGLFLVMSLFLLLFLSSNVEAIVGVSPGRYDVDCGFQA